jgi:hypothetical protein
LERPQFMKFLFEYLGFEIFDTLDDAHLPEIGPGLFEHGEDDGGFIAGAEGFIRSRGRPKRFIFKHKDFKLSTVPENTIDEVLNSICFDKQYFGISIYEGHNDVKHWKTLFADQRMYEYINNKNDINF